MTTAKGRDVRVFLAGALALIGFRAMVLVPYYFQLYIRFTDPLSAILAIGASAYAAIGLLIGVVMLRSDGRVVFWTRIYLLAGIVAQVVAGSLAEYTSSTGLDWKRVSDMLVPVALFGLLEWSRSKRFRDPLPSP